MSFPMPCLWILPLSLYLLLSLSLGLSTAGLGCAVVLRWEGGTYSQFTFLARLEQLYCDVLCCAMMCFAVLLCLFIEG